MFNLMKRVILTLILSFILSGIISISAQTLDSLSLGSVLKQVVTNYPAIKKGEQELKAAEARINLAKSGYLPDVSINSNFMHIGPLSSLDVPGLGSFSLYPANNYSASVDYRQSIYDFGKTATNVAFENQNREIANLSAEQLKQRLSLSVINVYYSIVFLQEAIRIKDEQLNTLNEHLQFVEKKKATGSATQYEVLTTKVRISTVENQKTDLQTVLKVQICQLNSLLGQPEKNAIVLRKELQSIQFIHSTDSLIDLATQRRNELKSAQEKTTLSELHYKVVGAENDPAFNFIATGGVKNGYIPDINEGRLNYAVGVGVKIPLYDASRTKYNLQKVKAEIQSNKEDLELTRRSIVNEVVESQANIHSALQKIAQSELQLQQAQQAFALAETSFKSGVITNLELLDNSTSLSEVGLSVLKAKIDYSLSLLKLKISVGDQIYK
jgi:outer membrane protein